MGPSHVEPETVHRPCTISPAQEFESGEAGHCSFIRGPGPASRCVGRTHCSGPGNGGGSGSEGGGRGGGDIDTDTRELWDGDEEGIWRTQQYTGVGQPAIALRQIHQEQGQLVFSCRSRAYTS